MARGRTGLARLLVIFAGMQESPDRLAMRRVLIDAAELLDPESTDVAEGRRALEAAEER